MARRRRRKNFRYGLLAVAISAVLWGIAHSSKSVERGFDVPIAFEELPDDLVITQQSDDEINIRVRASQAALRNLSPADLEYAVNVSGAKAGQTVHEVEVGQLDLPRGITIVSRSPAQMDVRLERRGRKNVRVRPELTGELPEGFALGEVEIEPERIWVTGARSSVLRLTEVVTETIDVSELDDNTEREVKLSLTNDHVWREGDDPIKVRIVVEPVEQPELAGETVGEESGV